MNGIGTFAAGNIKQEVTSITLVNNAAHTEDISVPSGKRWKLISIKMINCDNVARDLSIVVYKEAAKSNLLFQLVAATSVNANYPLHWPCFITGLVDAIYWYFDCILTGANKISCIWAAGGASSGATDTDGLVITYLELPV